MWSYYSGLALVFRPPEGEFASFRLFTAQLVCAGRCRQADVVRTFGVSKNSVLRSVRKYREQGIGSFYRRPPGRGPTVMTAAVTAPAETLLACGRTRREVAEALGVNYETLRKALEQGRVRAPAPLRGEEEVAPSVSVTDKSTRSEADAAAGEELGVACTRPVERVLAAVGQLPAGAPVRFLVPRLLQDVPGQPTAEELQAAPQRSRFVLVFDRAGDSPAFFRELWEQHRIACLTYHKHPTGEWAEQEFQETEVRLPVGETVTLRLAERGSWSGSRKEGLWLQELRKLTDSGPQVSLISTAFDRLGPENAGLLFSRWSQENFFAYRRKHFALDALNECGTEVIPGTNKPVVNPDWRELDRQHRSVRSQLTQRPARFAAGTLHPAAEGPALAKWERQQAAVIEEIEQWGHALKTLHEQKQSPPHPLDWDQLPADQKCERLAPSRKRLLDTVRLVAYRAETALANLVREQLAHEDEARSLLRDLFRSDADLHPDPAAGVLAVNVHTFANPRSNRAIQHLLNHLNEAEFTYPGTTLRLRYTLAGEPRT